MLPEKTNDAQFKALAQDYHTLHEEHQALLEYHRTLLGQHPGTTASSQHLQDYCQSHQEQQHLIQQFRQRVHTHLLLIRSYRSTQHSQRPAGAPLIRKTILLGEGNEQDATFLKERMQQAHAHRLFLAVDSSQVVRLVQNVHIDVLVLDNGLTPLPGMELYHQLHVMKGLETLPAIIISACFSPFLQAELAHHHLIGLEKPLKVEALVKAIDQLLV